MKFVVFGAEGRLGLVHENRVLDLAAAARVVGAADDAESIFGSLLTLIEAGDRGLERCAGLLDRFGASDDPGVTVELAKTPLHAPFPRRRLALAGSNNAAHVSAYHRNHGNPTTAEEVRTSARQEKAGGFWVVTEPVGTGAEILAPRSASGYFDYEGEVAVVLGKGGKRVPAADWDERIWGVTLVIDWSIRAPKFQLPWYAHKNFDTSKSLGPWISVGEVDPLKVTVETRVNGEVRQRFTNGEHMIFSYAELLEQMSEDLTLHPGDVLAGGTGPGTALDSTPGGTTGMGSTERYLKEGDTVEVSADGLGTLLATIVPSS